MATVEDDVPVDRHGVGGGGLGDGVGPDGHLHQAAVDGEGRDPDILRRQVYPGPFEGGKLHAGVHVEGRVGSAETEVGMVEPGLVGDNLTCQQRANGHTEGGAGGADLHGGGAHRQGVDGNVEGEAQAETAQGDFHLAGLVDHLKHLRNHNILNRREIQQKHDKGHQAHNAQQHP